MDPSLTSRLATLADQISTVVVGKRPQIEDCIACLLAAGHLLIEDVPGVGKTTLAHALAMSLGLDFRRVQFTADLLPSDLVGVSVFERAQDRFVFHPGPVFAQVLLADEINRAGPKTQSALLEAMEEQQVSVENETRALPHPFFVIATQNPSDQLGTYPLPESQLDRFLMRITLGYPDRASERALLAGRDRREAVRELQPVMKPAELEAAQRAVLAVHASEPLLDYLQTLIAATRSGRFFVEGLSPRPASRCCAPRAPRRCSPGATTSRRTTCRRSCRRPSRTACTPCRAPAVARSSRYGRWSRRPRSPDVAGPPSVTGAAAAASPTGVAADASGAGPAWSPRAQFRRWWQSRLPLTDSWTLGQRNVYILPTRAGLTFVLTLLVMLIAAINYQLNLGFALTFLLAGAGGVSMHLTHGNLRGLTLHLKAPPPGYAGDPVPLEVVVTNPGRARHALGLRLERADMVSAWCDVPAGGQEALHLAIVPPRRGWHAVPPLVLETVFPFGLFRAWTVWRPAARVLAWPRPEVPAPPLPPAGAAGGEELARQRSEGGEFDGVRPWRRGDTMRQVVWKKVARSNELVSRETTGSGRRELWLDWSATGGGGDVELRLARLTAWVLAAHGEALPFGLRLPGDELPLGAGEAHRRAALERLALWS
jgi:MoxR-like ATPase